MVRTSSISVTVILDQVAFAKDLAALAAIEDPACDLKQTELASTETCTRMLIGRTTRSRRSQQSIERLPIGTSERNDATLRAIETPRIDSAERLGFILIYPSGYSLKPSAGFLSLTFVY